MTRKHMMKMKRYHKAMSHNHMGHSAGPLVFGALGLGALYLWKKRSHHKNEGEEQACCKPD